MKKSAPRFLPIGKVSKRTGLSISAIRYYESENLVHPIRNAGGQRLFHRADIRRLSFIMIAQQLGFSLKQIRNQLDKLSDRRAPTKKDWTRISKDFKRELDQRIELLLRMRAKLDQCIGCGCLSLKACALYNPDDQAQKLGAGPRYILGDDPPSN